MTRITIFVFALLLVSCGHNGPDTPVKTDPTRNPFAGGEHKAIAADLCKPDAQGKYPTDTVFSDRGDKGTHLYAVGGSCILRPIREVWAVLHGGPSAAWINSDLKGFQRLPDPRVAFLFESQHEAGPFFARQKWTMEWYHTLAEGTFAAPGKLLVHYKKVKGTGHIPHWQGTLELVRVTDNVTAVSALNELKATTTGMTETESSIRDILTKMRKLPATWDHLSKIAAPVANLSQN